LLVITIRVLPKSAVRPSASVSRPSPSTAGSRSNTSGWAFSISSSSTTPNGCRLTAAVSNPSGSAIEQPRPGVRPVEQKRPDVKRRLAPVRGLVFLDVDGDGDLHGASGKVGSRKSEDRLGPALLRGDAAAPPGSSETGE
jgi:hypothetical protein